MAEKRMSLAEREAARKNAIDEGLNTFIVNFGIDEARMIQVEHLGQKAYYPVKDALSGLLDAMVTNINKGRGARSGNASPAFKLNIALSKLVPAEQLESAFDALSKVAEAAARKAKGEKALG